MKATTILWDCANVYKKTFRYALITWTIFLLDTGVIAWIMHQTGPHPAYEEMIIGKNGWTSEYEGTYNQLGAIIYLTMAFRVAMILFAPLLGGVLFNDLQGRSC